jgi:hypothetical protein
VAASCARAVKVKRSPTPRGADRAGARGSAWRFSGNRPGQILVPAHAARQHTQLLGARKTRYLFECYLTGGIMRPRHKIFEMKFADVYPLYIKKGERKNRSKDEVDQIICWLTGYNLSSVQQQIEQEHDFETFFAQAPAIHPNSSLIKGVVCGVRVEEIEDPLMQKIRYLDKLIDELAKGKTMDKILRQSVE